MTTEQIPHYRCDRPVYPGRVRSTADQSRWDATEQHPDLFSTDDPAAWERHHRAVRHNGFGMGDVPGQRGIRVDRANRVTLTVDEREWLGAGVVWGGETWGEVTYPLHTGQVWCMSTRKRAWVVETFESGPNELVEVELSALTCCGDLDAVRGEA